MTRIEREVRIRCRVTMLQIINEIKSKIGLKRFSQINDGTRAIEVLASEIALSSEFYEELLRMDKSTPEYNNLFNKYVKLETLISNKIKLFSLSDAFQEEVPEDTEFLTKMDKIIGGKINGEGTQKKEEDFQKT